MCVLARFFVCLFLRLCVRAFVLLGCWFVCLCVRVHVHSFCCSCVCSFALACVYACVQEFARSCFFVRGVVCIIDWLSYSVFVRLCSCLLVCVCSVVFSFVGFCFIDVSLRVCLVARLRSCVSLWFA